jgi:DNA (cytosine-5)-methyltransferase 1
MPVPHTSVSESSSLPTPRSRDWKNQAANEKTALGRIERGYGLDIAETIALLRTPAASEAERGHQPEHKAKARGGQVTLSGQTNFGGDFGRFEPAIRRWEQITGNKAPEPTKSDGKDGNPRLSSHFTEWMMGLQPGWITAVGLSRKDELKACGNGVVPQQAKLALTILLDRVGGTIE